MKTVILMLMATVTLCNAQGYHYNSGYTNRYGTYVRPYYQTNPDRNFYNNYSTYPNYNPWTGRQGTVRTMPRGYGYGGYNPYGY